METFIRTDDYAPTFGWWIAGCLAGRETTPQLLNQRIAPVGIIAVALCHGISSRAVTTANNWQELSSNPLVERSITAPCGPERRRTP